MQINVNGFLRHSSSFECNGNGDALVVCVCNAQLQKTNPTIKKALFKHLGNNITVNPTKCMGFTKALFKHPRYNPLNEDERGLKKI